VTSDLFGEDPANFEVKSVVVVRYSFTPSKNKDPDVKAENVGVLTKLALLFLKISVTTVPLVGYEF
jgi:hypothetical protein